MEHGWSARGPTGCGASLANPQRSAACIAYAFGDLALYTVDLTTDRIRRTATVGLGRALVSAGAALTAWRLAS